MQTTSCKKCSGTVVLTLGPGRLRTYRGMLNLHVPDDLGIRTCTACGTEYFSRGELLALAAALEPERERRLRETLFSKPMKFASRDVADLRVSKRPRRVLRLVKGQTEMVA